MVKFDGTCFVAVVENSHMSVYKKYSGTARSYSSLGIPPVMKKINGDVTPKIATVAPTAVANQPPPTMSLTLQATLSPKIGFASHQNSVPILQELMLKNTGDEPLTDVSVTLSADPAFLEAKTWKIDVIRPSDELKISDREIRLSGNYLSELMESVRGHIDIEVHIGDSEEEFAYLRETYPVELLSKTHWGGIGSMPELLPAFCMPNDPAIDKILKAASDVLRRAGKNAGINGYEDRSRSRTWQLASAIWSSIAGLGLGYAHPPASFEVEGQKIRTPGAIIDRKLATCLDTSALFASALEQAGLNPILILSQGHAFVGVWLQPQEFSQLITEEAAAIRKRIELQELVAFETTLVTQSPAAAFSVAVEVTGKRLTDEEFQMAIDVRRARMRKIRPLGFTEHVAPAGAEGESVLLPTEALEEAPPLPGFDVEVTSEPKTAEDRVDQWQRKLLDLTARNRLLHLPERSKHVPLVCKDPGSLEDLLAAGKTIRISPVPDFEAGGRDIELYQQSNKEDLIEQYAEKALESNEVLSSLPKKKLETDLIDLYRKANTDMTEGGANTLFLALGFLKWKKSAEDPRSYRAPLILLPVKLNRRSARSGVTMSVHEDEPRFNLTLLELLRQDFDLNIPGLDGELPEDASGIDVEGIWTRVRVAVKEIPGFEVTTETAIGTFSFSKYLMWKDLVDRREELSRNPVVKHLIERGEESYPEHSGFPKEDELDKVTSPANLFTPLPADSSQLAAVVASEAGCDFVLDGPPGTGKSQTIANMIVHNLLKGRRVLFVAEKMAALNVVYRRLKEKGLGDFCLEVHSHKTSKLDILQQLDRAWDVRGEVTEEEWKEETSRLKDLRDRLNLVCGRLHHAHPNGMSVHRAIGLVTRDYGPTTPRISWSDGTTHTREEFEKLREVAHRLDLNLEAYCDSPSDFSIIGQTEWSNGWQEKVLRLARALPKSVDTLTSARDRLQEALQISLQIESDRGVELLVKMTCKALKTYGKDFVFAFGGDLADRLDAAGRFVEILGEYRELEGQLSVNYAEEAARKVEPNELDVAWSEAEDKFWILASFGKKKVAKHLATTAGASTLPDVPADSPRFRRMKELLSEIDKMAPLLTGFPGYAELRSQTDQLARAVETAAGLKQCLSLLAHTPDDLVSLKGAIRRLVVDANELLGPDGAVAAATDVVESALGDYREKFAEFTELCAVSEADALTLVQVRESSNAIDTNETRLRNWCAWRRARKEAIQLNLNPLVKAIESGGLTKGDIDSAFLTGYAKWFAAHMIDSEPILREFVSVEHMDSIEEFRALDGRVAGLSVQYARAALAGRLPVKVEVGRKDGYGILKHEIQKKRQHKPLRQLITEMGDAFGLLAPCMLMSPLSIAQYLPVDLQLFDLVIFDEASQIAPWDAVGSIARAKQVVVAGDPRQMPPTNFFQRGTSDSAFDDNVGDDLESILDECLAVGIPRHNLSWHYRSRHESLIAFSNIRYYGGNLITFPSSETRESAVTWRKVDGIYAKGRGRTNQVEAKAIVEETVKRLRDPDFRDSGQTIGIITLNTDQQALIEDLLDAARREHPEIESSFDQSLSEPVFVKNLETVQGDERDIIFLGVGYGPTEPGAGTMSMNFGPLNRDGGERRLNVAVTRSRREMIVFSSFDPSMIDLNRTSARAVRDLKHFIEFAERGPRALGEAVHGSVGGYDSPFEESVAQRLGETGWEVVPQVGVSRFRIDLGIVHPDRPGDFLVGVECDGATYHSASTARDRDKVRAAVLEGLGWTLLRVWSTDWFVDPQGELERLNTALRELLETDRAARVAEAEQQGLDGQSEPDRAGTEESSAPAGQVEICSEPLPDHSVKKTPSADEAAQKLYASDSGSAPDVAEDVVTTYQVTNYSDFADRLCPDDFHDDSYTTVLREMILHTLECEAPISDDLLVQRIARAHGFKRSGRLIRNRIFDLIDEHFYLREDPVGGSFVWLHEDQASFRISVRVPSGDDSTRSFDFIPSEEIWAGLKHIDGGDPALELARLFGIRRLSGSGRERVEAALRIAHSPGDSSEKSDFPS
jgi:very-short-patch-repair endonuclease